MRSIYHIREYCVRKLSLVSTFSPEVALPSESLQLPSADIFLSHDWPQSIEHHGDLAGLLSRKSFLRSDIQSGELGSPPLMSLLHTLRPQWWFAAHLHTRYAATVVHAGAPAPAPVPVANPDEIQIDDEEFDTAPASTPAEPPAPAAARNPDEITLEEEEDAVEAPAPPPPVAGETHFLALDKCLPQRQFLEVIDIAAPLSTTDAPLFAFDPEWLAICRAFHPWLSMTRQQPVFPEEAEARALVAQERAWVDANVKTDERGSLPIGDCQTFAMTAPGPGSEGRNKLRQRWSIHIYFVKIFVNAFAAPWYTNPQTEAFCRMLDIPNKINPPPTVGICARSPQPPPPTEVAIGA